MKSNLKWLATLALLKIKILIASAGTPIVQEYYLPYPENYVYNALKTIFPSNTGCGFTTLTPNVSPPIRTYISIAPYLSNTIIYYDHWEDGYETELTNPSQTSTQIWGDNNSANGIPPGFSTDIITAGQSIVLQNNINPSNLTLVDWDARDRVGATKPVGVTKSHWATGSETLMAGTLLSYPIADWGLNFRLPLGQDVFTSVESFSYTGFSVMACQSGTVVSIDADNNGSFETSVTLGQGEAYQMNGGVTKGARINSTKPIQVHLTTGDICANYESRWFVIPPLTSWGNYFFGPAAGTDKTYIIYNPNSSTIKIKGKSSSGNLTDIDLAANAVYEVNGIASSGYQFWSNDGSPFMTLALSDASGNLPANNKDWDWGASLLPQTELTQQVIVGWAPGHDPNFISIENSAPVWLTVSYPQGNASGNSARVCIDYDGDNAGGSYTDSYGRNYDTFYDLTPLTSQKVYDPDGDQTNMVLWICDGSRALISAIWGEEAGFASVGSPGLDLGTGIPGIQPFYAYKDATIFTDLNSNGQYNVGDVVQYKIGITNPGLVPVSGTFNVSDVLPTYVSYVNGSTQLTTPSGTSAITDAGATNFPLDEGGKNISLTLNPGQEAYVTFRATIIAANCITNTAYISKDGTIYSPYVTICATSPPEICTGGVDEDSDGLIDCNDPDCFNAGAAGGQFCLGNTISLTAFGGTSYSWSGPSSFTSTLQNPTRASATYAMSGTYTVTITGSGCSATKTATVNVANCSPSYTSCSGAACVGANLISSGTFESFSTGSPGFTTDFNYVNCGSAYSGSYSVVQSAANCSANWAAAPDRTLGNGNGKYMVADFAATSPGQNLNGNSTSGEIFCVASVPVSSATTYCFSAYFLKLCSSCSGNPDLAFVVNGITVGTVSGSSLGTGAWTKFGFSFSTTDFGNPSSITVCIQQTSFGSNGYDLALDDIELRAILSGTTPTTANDVATACNTNSQTINVLANDANYVSSTLAINSQPPSTAGTAYISSGNVVFVPVPGFVGTTSFTYSVCGAVSNGCCATASVTVTIATITATAASDSPVCTGVDLHLTASGGNTYSWTGPNGFTASTAFATINNPTTAASGTYSVTVSNSAGCTANASVVATVNSCVTNRPPECNCN